mgnify:FL=1
MWPEPSSPLLRASPSRVPPQRNRVYRTHPQRGLLLSPSLHDGEKDFLAYLNVMLKVPFSRRRYSSPLKNSHASYKEINTNSSLDGFQLTLSLLCDNRTFVFGKNKRKNLWKWQKPHNKLEWKLFDQEKFQSNTARDFKKGGLNYVSNKSRFLLFTQFHSTINIASGFPVRNQLLSFLPRMKLFFVFLSYCSSQS